MRVCISASKVNVTTGAVRTWCLLEAATAARAGQWPGDTTFDAARISIGTVRHRSRAKAVERLIAISGRQCQRSGRDGVLLNVKSTVAGS